MTHSLFGARMSSGSSFSPTWKKRDFSHFNAHCKACLKQNQKDKKIDIKIRTTIAWSLSWFDSAPVKCGFSSQHRFNHVSGSRCHFFSTERSVYVGQGEKWICRSQHEMISIWSSCGQKEEQFYVEHFKNWAHFNSDLKCSYRGV